MQVIVLNATGRLPERKIAEWFEALHICLSYPDARIWCNQIGNLSGGIRASVVAATSAGNMAMDSRTYGAKTLLDGMTFIQTALKKFKKGVSIKDILNAESHKIGKKHIVTGYARPIANGDERIAAMERVAQKLGFSREEHLELAYDIEQYMSLNYGEKMNLNGYAAAFLSDQRFSKEESYRICTMLVASGVTACYVDALDRPPNSFLPLHCKDIVYTGNLSRSVPQKC